MTTTTDKDPLGTRMKEQYERRAATYLPRRTFTIVRLDGKAFHTYTRGLDKPFDQQLMDDMSATTKYLCEEVEGAVFGYTQSDEISLLLTDFAQPKTEAFFNGAVQKIVSVTASLTTAFFNKLRPGKLAFFDSRVFTIPDPVEVANYFIWRQRDATRNSVSMAAQSVYSHKELHGKSTNEMQEMLFQKGINWNDYPVRFRRGTSIERQTVTGPVTYVHKRTGETIATDTVTRRVWSVEEPGIFTVDSFKPVKGAA